MTVLQMTDRCHGAYKRVNVVTANPGMVLITLYDAAIKHVRAATEEIAKGDVRGKGVSLGRAHAIVAEFVNALDHSRAPELCANLERIYGFMIARIAAANNEMDAAALAPVLDHLSSLRQAWVQAVDAQARSASPVERA
jgi:flagellar protein FliS